MLQTLAVQKQLMGVRVMGKHHLTEKELTITFWDTVPYVPTTAEKWPMANFSRAAQ